METEKIIERANKAVTEAFNNGAELTKRRLIEKGRKWIEKNFKSDGYFSLYYLGGGIYTPEKIAEDFCKAMEEEL